MSELEIKKSLTEVVGQPSELLALLKELSSSVPAEEIIQALIASLEDSTDITLLRETNKVYDEVKELFIQYSKSENKGALLSEIGLKIKGLKDLTMLRELFDFAIEELSLRHTDGLIQLLRHRYSDMTNKLMEE